MKKNSILYVLLAFLIVVNGFFLYNYTGKFRKNNKPQQPDSFVINELAFSDSQLEKYNKTKQSYSESMMGLSENIKDLKDDLFNKLSETTVDERAIDSITSLLGQIEKQKRTKVFYHFKEIQNICNEEQKIIFNSIINDALHNRDNVEQGFPNGEGKGNQKHPPPQK